MLTEDEVRALTALHGEQTVSEPAMKLDGVLATPQNSSNG